MRLIHYFDQEANNYLCDILNPSETQPMIDRANNLRVNGYPNFRIPVIPTYDEVVSYLNREEYVDGNEYVVGDLSINVAWETLEFEWV